MGNYASGCSHVVDSVIESFGFGGEEDAHPKGIVVNGVEYTTTRLVGEGGYAFVYEGYNSNSGQRVALKKYVFSESKQQLNASEEMTIYQSVCPNDFIVSYLDSEVHYRARVPLPEMWVVMEFCEGPSLQGYLNNAIDEGHRLSVKEAYDIISSIVQAIGHLHTQSPPVSHWDIKPDNFLFTESGSLKLCDFGSASRQYYLAVDANQVAVAEGELESRMTLLYQPPEALDLWSKQKVDTKADIWALGVIIYVLVFMEMPFEANKLDIMSATPSKLRNDGRDIPEEFRPLMNLVQKHLFIKNPEERSDIFTFSHDFALLSGTQALAKPRPGFQSAQRPRFD